MSNYSKNLSGVNQKVFVSPALAYTTDATLAAFIANAPEGEIGIYMASGARKADALAAGDEFQIVQMKDGFLNKTPLLKFNDITSKRLTDYVAPVRKVVAIGYNGTSGDIGISTTTASSSNALTFGISVRETTPGNQPFPVQEGYATAVSSTADEYTILDTICAQLNGVLDYENTLPDRFVKAEILSNGAVTEFAEDPVFTNGSKVVTFAGNVTIAAGAFVQFSGAGGPVYKVATGVTAGTSITLERPYQGASGTVDVSATTDIAGVAAYTSGTTALGVRLTGLSDETHFVVTGIGELATTATTVLTNWLLGSGSGASVVEMEKQSQIFDGVGGTVNAAFKEDFGQPTAFASATSNYDLYFIDLAPTILPSAALPVYKQTQIQRVVIAAPESGTTPTANLATILGL